MTTSAAATTDTSATATADTSATATADTSAAGAGSATSSGIADQSGAVRAFVRKSKPHFGHSRRTTSFWSSAQLGQNVTILSSSSIPWQREQTYFGSRRFILKTWPSTNVGEMPPLLIVAPTPATRSPIFSFRAAIRSYSGLVIFSSRQVAHMCNSRIGSSDRIWACWCRNSRAGRWASETSTRAALPAAAVSRCSTMAAKVSTSRARLAGIEPGCDATITATPRAACVSASVNTVTPRLDVKVTESTPFQALGMVLAPPSIALPATPTAPPTALAVRTLLCSIRPTSAARLQKVASAKANDAAPSSLASPRSTRRWTSARISRYWRLTPQVLPTRLRMLSVRCTRTTQPEASVEISKTARTGICFLSIRDEPRRLPRLASMRVS